MAMEYRQLGRCGLRVSAISIGGWLTIGGSVDEAASDAILRAAIDGGVNFVDLADIYAKGEAERVAGRTLRHYPRHELVVSTKVFWPMSADDNDRGLSRKHIVESVERSLKRLGMDYLDIYFCHREDPEVPLEETSRAMDDLVRQGKILHWGTSMWSPKRLRAACRIARRLGADGPVVEQPRYNLLHRSIERRVMPTVRRLGMGLVVWSPLAGGVLTGKYLGQTPAGSRGASGDLVRDDLADAARRRVRDFIEVAKGLGHEPGPVALAWLLARPGVSSVITGATRPEHVRDNLQALSITLTPESIRDIGRLFRR